MRPPHLNVYPNLSHGQLSFSLLCSLCLMKDVLSLQPGPCLHPSPGFGLFTWSAQILQRSSPWHNMLRVPRFNWHGLVPCIGLSAGHPARAHHVRAHQTSCLTDGLTVSSQGGCCNRLTASAKGWELGSVPWWAARCGGCEHWLGLAGIHVPLHTGHVPLCSSPATFSWETLVGKGDFCSCKASLLSLCFPCSLLSPWGDCSHQHCKSPSKGRDPGGNPAGVATRLRKREDTAQSGKRHELLRVHLRNLPNFLPLSPPCPSLGDTTTTARRSRS